MLGILTCVLYIYGSLRTNHVHHPRSYPTGLGVSIHKVYQAALEGEVVAPLRFGIPVDRAATAAELFQALPLGDSWMDAKMADVFEYMYACKHVRTDPFLGPKVVYTCAQNKLQESLLPACASCEDTCPVPGCHAGIQG